MASGDLQKEQLYESVKQLVECDAKSIHLPQQKLFTLFSIAFQFMLYRSTKEKGHYIIRIEDTFLAEKLARKSKDEMTRKLMEKLILPRKLRYNDATLHLDYFNLATWSVTNDLPKDKIKGALVVKNTSNTPIIEESDFRHIEDSLTEQANLPKNYYFTCLQEFIPKTVIIAFESDYEDVFKISFPFIKDKDRETVSGVKISSDVDISKIKE